MSALREIYDFITGGSVASVVFVALAIVCAFTLPVFRGEAFVGCAAVALIAAAFEKPS